MDRSRWLVALAALGGALVGARFAGGEDSPAPIPAELTFTYHQTSTTKPEEGQPPTVQTVDYTVSMPGFLEVVQENGPDDFRRQMMDTRPPKKPKGSAYTFTLPEAIIYGTAKPDGHSRYTNETRMPIATSRVEGSGAGGRISVSLETTGQGDDLRPYAGLAQLALDDEKSTYKSEDGTKTEKTNTFPWPGGGAVEVPWSEEYRHGLGSDGPTPAPVMKGLSFSKLSKAIKEGTATTIFGTESWTYEDEAKTKFSGSASVKLSVRPPGYEAILVPVSRDAYDKWLPKGPALPKRSGAGAALELEVVLRDKKTHAPITNIAYKARYRLSDVSHMPGVCTNYPQEKRVGAGAKLTDEDLEFGGRDLKFVKDANAADAVIAAEGMELTTADGKGGEPVSVSSFDYGAWGRVQATAITKDGDVPAQVDPELPADKGGETISIPRDDNHNHVADVWEKDKAHDVFDANLDARWDLDQKFGKQRRAGDGYTLYEEYRGFVCLVEGVEKHVRTDPLAKDCFIYDPNDLFLKYYEKANPSKLVWHYVDTSMFRFANHTTEDMKALDPNHRWVNTNSDEGNETGTFYARQYCVHLVDHWIDAAGAGDAQDYNELRSVENKKGIKCLEAPAVSPLKNIYRVCVSIDLLTKVEMHNYGPKDGPAVLEAQIKTTVIHEVGHAIGIRHHRPADQRNTDGTGSENDDSVTSGVNHCAMHYQNDAELHDVAFMKKALVDYCQAGETFKDKDGNDAPGDDCFDQIDVKSDP